MTFTLPFGKDFSVIDHVLQRRPLLLHSSQYDVLAQGVFMPSRKAFAGAT
jgi:hypothetical protein